MGQEQEQQQRIETFAAFQVNQTVMAMANDDALFMHCLPAHRGEEVSIEVLESAQSVVWQEAENRLHAQKALLEFLLSPEF
jgi:ornithine carbamoyltransferase